VFRYLKVPDEKYILFQIIGNDLQPAASLIKIKSQTHSSHRKELAMNMTAINEHNQNVDQIDLEMRVKAMYRSVALFPESDFHFEMGRSMAERLGYPPLSLTAYRRRPSNHLPASDITSVC
jgi:hypothetical protein